jgi:hypothetical protein
MLGQTDRPVDKDRLEALLKIDLNDKKSKEILVG